MKTKLFSLFYAFFSVFSLAQFTTGTVSLPTTGMTVKIDTTPTNVTLTLTGSNTSWLGIGFNTNTMSNSSVDTFIYSSSANRDYTINGYITPSSDAIQDWSVTSNTVSGTTRTIVATRTLAGSSGDYLFPNAAGNLNIIYARGGSTTLSQHASSDTAILTFSTNLGVEDIDANKNNFKVYPNPAKDVISFEFSGKIKNISIYDTSGKLLKSDTSSKKSINISELKNGIYFIEIENTENQKVFEKFIKN